MSRYEADRFVNMLQCLIDNIFAMFGGHIFQQTVGITLGTKCAPLLADLFLYSHEAYSIKGLLKKNEKKHVVNQTLEHVDDISFSELFGRMTVFFVCKITYVAS
jgi:hypothetical protein